ncbi:hypothetical protein D3C73_1627430 [compost metagenome]
MLVEMMNQLKFIGIERKMTGQSSPTPFHDSGDNIAGAYHFCSFAMQVIRF